LDSKTFYEINDIHENAKPNERIWTNELAMKYNYPSSEAMRSSYRRAKKIYGGEKKLVENKIEKPFGFPKILIMDIETSPLVVFSWQIYETKILPENVIYDWFMISYSAKWLFENDITSEVLVSDEAVHRNDERIILSMWKLLDEADLVITFNGDHFDIKKLNTRFLKYNLPPPSFYRSIDLYKVAKDNFAMTSNKLSFVNNFLGIDDKTHTGFELWKRCYEGEDAALKEMETYNINDSRITEMLYLKILPWIKNHPNLGLYIEENVSVCPKCGSRNIIWDNKYYYTQLAKYDTFRCGDCHAIGKSRKNLIEKEKKKVIIQ
jgi:DNA polymerase elongation subunit (family B)